MLKVLPEDVLLDLNGLQKRLKDIRYYGYVTLVFQDGEIVLIEEKRTLKPGQFDRFF